MTMYLPEHVLRCIERLENAGFAAYAVGGCVRDALQGLQPHDYDLCTAALPEQTQAVFAGCDLVLAGVRHGTVGVITDGGVVEITTFRTEGGYADNRHPEWVRFVPEIEADLARRDFTVNAMAYSPMRGFADPFGGQRDLREKLLRAVGDPDARFTEDALRILRGARFAARFSLTPEEKTMDAMLRHRALLDSLARERVFEELCKLLLVADADDLLTFAPILGAAIPELAPMIGFDQRNRHHAYDLFTHTAHVTAAVPRELTLRWAALLHDTGKIATFTVGADGQGHFYGHEKQSAAIAERVLRRLKAPTRLRLDALKLVELHMVRLEPEKKVVRRWVSRLGTDTFQNLLTLQAADTGSKGKDASDSLPARLRRILREIEAEDACLSLKDLAIDGNDLKALGCRGREIGQTLNRLLELVLDEQLPNEKQAMLQYLNKEDTL